MALVLTMPLEMCLTIYILSFIPRNLCNATLTAVKSFFFFSVSIEVPNAIKLNMGGEIAFQGPVESTGHGHQGLI